MRSFIYLLLNLLIVLVLPVDAQEDDAESLTFPILSKNLVINNYNIRNINSKETLDFLCHFANQQNDQVDDNFLEIGGAVRFNLLYTRYEGETFPLGTNNRNDWTWDTWRLNFNGKENDILFSFEYRFYPTFIHILYITDGSAIILLLICNFR